MAGGHAPREPFGGELARDLRALQLDLRKHGARHAPGALFGEREYARMEPAVVELAQLAQIEVAADLRGTHVEALRKRARGELGGAGLARDPALLVAQQVSVELERDPGGLGDGLLE